MIPLNATSWLSTRQEDPTLAGFCTVDACCQTTVDEAGRMACFELTNSTMTDSPSTAEAVSNPPVSNITNVVTSLLLYAGIAHFFYFHVRNKKDEESNFDSNWKAIRKDEQWTYQQQCPKCDAGGWCRSNVVIGCCGGSVIYLESRGRVDTSFSTNFGGNQAKFSWVTCHCMSISLERSMSTNSFVILLGIIIIFFSILF